MVTSSQGNQKLWLQKVPADEPCVRKSSTSSEDGCQMKNFKWHRTSSALLHSHVHNELRASMSSLNHFIDGSKAGYGTESFLDLCCNLVVVGNFAALIW